MAITSNFEAFGVTFENAYTRISNVEYSNGLQENWIMSEDPEVAPVKEMVKILRVKFTAKTYANATADVPFRTEDYHVVFETGDTLVESCYAHLKTLPEFTGAQDA